MTAPRMAGLSRRPLTALTLTAAVALLAACGGGSGDKASQTAAKVNKEEITVHQINYLLARQQGLRAEQAEAASKQVLERLIDQELAVQKAQEQKLDRDPRVVQQLEFARREILAAAYVERLGESVAKPTNDEIAKYYAENPALFKDRRIYSLQEVQIEAKPDQLETLRAKLSSAKNLNEFAEFLKANNFRFVGNQAVRAAEQLPLTSLEGIAKMKDGDSVISPSANGFTVLFLLGSRSEPVDEVRARPAIEAFLVNQRKGVVVQKEIKSLRESSKVEYVGKFAAAAASGVQPAAAPAASAAEPAASGALDPATVSKGLGIK